MNTLIPQTCLIKSFANIENSGLYLGSVEAHCRKTLDLEVSPGRVLGWHSEDSTCVRTFQLS